MCRAIPWLSGQHKVALSYSQSTINAPSPLLLYVLTLSAAYPTLLFMCQQFTSATQPQDNTLSRIKVQDPLTPLRLCTRRGDGLECFLDLAAEQTTSTSETALTRRLWAFSMLLEEAECPSWQRSEILTFRNTNWVGRQGRMTISILQSSLHIK